MLFASDVATSVLDLTTKPLFNIRKRSIDTRDRAWISTHPFPLASIMMVKGLSPS
jgi:hypothetical protein